MTKFYISLFALVGIFTSVRSEKTCWYNELKLKIQCFLNQLITTVNGQYLLSEIPFRKEHQIHLINISLLKNY